MFGFLLALGLLLDLCQFAQAGVPVSFQHIGDQAILRIDPEKTALCQFGCVASTFYLLGTQTPGFLYLSMQFLVDLYAGLDSERGQLRQQKISDRRIQTCPKQTLTALVVALFDMLLLTKVFRIEALAILDIVVAHCHSVAAASADDQPLKQRRSFPWGTVATILSMRLAIGTQLGEIGFIVFPTDVASMHLSNEKLPLLLGKGFNVQ